MVRVKLPACLPKIRRPTPGNNLNLGNGCSRRRDLRRDNHIFLILSISLGLLVSISGTLSCARKEIIELIQFHGGSVASTLTKKVNILISSHSDYESMVQACYFVP